MKLATNLVGAARAGARNLSTLSKNGAHSNLARQCVEQLRLSSRSFGTMKSGEEGAYDIVTSSCRTTPL